MAITTSALTERETHEGKRVVELVVDFSTNETTDIDLATQLGMSQVDEVWVKTSNADANSVVVTSALPAYKGGTDITLDSDGAVTATVRFYGS